MAKRRKVVSKLDFFLSLVFGICGLLAYCYGFYSLVYVGDILKTICFCLLGVLISITVTADIRYQNNIIVKKRLYQKLALPLLLALFFILVFFINRKYVGVDPILLLVFMNVLFAIVAFNAANSMEKGFDILFLRVPLVLLYIVLFANVYTLIYLRELTEVLTKVWYVGVIFTFVLSVFVIFRSCVEKKDYFMNTEWFSH